MNANKVVKALHVSHIQRHKINHNLEKPLSVFNMVKPSCISIVFINMKQSIPERNYVNVFNMVESIQFSHVIIIAKKL